ncbi:MAG: PDDEXK nuclease domain-containing protein [Clostridiales bacterium]|jgi:predicted nuclease of restriction endonuclease-like (RecB) superfamily|nr:PDDEXK nuclease domain-containing protein [Clostridiales bacterium]
MYGGDNVMNETEFFKAIADLINSARRHAEKSVNTAMVVTYYEIGRRIVEKEQGGEKRAKYGQHLLQELSKYLTDNIGKGYSVQNLRLFRQFYMEYSDSQIRQTMFSELTNSDLQISETVFSKFSPAISWSHYIKLMRIKDLKERRFYEVEIADNNWSLSEFRRQFDTSLYERLALSRDKDKVRELSQKGQRLETPGDLFKEPYVLEFTGLSERAEYSESDLEQRLIDHLQKFMLELGKGFAYMGRQVRITYSEKHFWVDLVFYNRLLRCFVLIDLKLGEISHNDTGQMQTYVNYYDRKIKMSDENPTIGIVLCKDKDDALVEMMLPEDNNQIFAARYQTILPSKEELRKALEWTDTEEE